MIDFITKDSDQRLDLAISEELDQPLNQHLDFVDLTDELNLEIESNFDNVNQNLNQEIETEEISQDEMPDEISQAFFDSLLSGISGISASNEQEDFNQPSAQEADSISTEEQDFELQKAAYEFFIEEAGELLALIDRELDVVLADRQVDKIHDISRAAHSLKGGARSAGKADLGNIAFRVEKTFKALYNEEIIIDAELDNYIRTIYETLRKSLTARLNNQIIDEQAQLATADHIWSQIENKLGDALTKAEEYLPSSSDLGIDIATSIFEVDVAEGIDHLTTVLADSDNYDLKEELNTTIEVFNGFGEMLALDGFVEICQTAATALNNYPENVMAIAQCFLDNMAIAKEQILNGDQSQQPTEALKAMATGESLSLTEQTEEIEELNLDEIDIFDNYLMSETETDITEENRPITISEHNELLEDYTEQPIDTTDQAYSFFCEEAPELLQTIEDGLLTIKEDRTIAKVHEIMRAAHSIKGGAASVGLEAIKMIAHKLEDVFKCFYNPEIEIDTDLESCLLDGYDCLRNPLMTQIQTGSYNAQEALNNTVELWQKFDQKLGSTLERADDYMPSSSELGVDIVASMFEIDVEQELERLRQVLVQEIDNSLIIGEIRATLEVFSGFGEMLNLPGFAEIANCGLMAIEQNPAQASEILNLIIQDAAKARITVLNGDRQRGGEPSQALTRLAKSAISDDIFDIMETEQRDNLEQEISPEEESERLNDVFDNSEGINELIIESSLIEQIAEIETPTLEDIFGLPIDSQQLNEIQNGLKDNQQWEDLETPTLEEIFASDSPQNQIEIDSESDEILTETTQEITQTDNENPPTLEEVFNSDDFNLLEQDISTLEETQPSLEEVFNSDNFNLLEEEISTPEETHPSLEEVFGENILSEIQSSENQNETENIKNNNFHTAQSISEIFQELPKIQNLTELKTTIAKPKKQEKNLIQKITPNTAKTNLTVRVDLDRLERMNNFIGELSINRNSLSLQNDKLQNSVKELLTRFVRFNKMATNLREMSDKMLIAPEKFGFSHKTNIEPHNLSEIENINSHSGGFDSLEMDSYGSLYSVIQSLIEDMIQLEEAVDDITLFAKQTGRSVEDQRQMVNNIRAELMWARMLPLGEVLNRFPRVLRDLCVKYKKQVNLKLTGTDVLVDKAALEKLYDPLVHLLRNAFDHGIETPETRKKQGKSPEGIIEVKAYHQGNQTVIEIRDDGQGIDIEKISAKAIDKGMITAEQLAVSNKGNLLDYIFEPGFSTAEKITDISGRGVGLDIVRSQLRSLKGSISVESASKKGTTFTLKLPLTLTIDKLLILLSGTNFFAFPSDNIEELLVPANSDLKINGGKRFLYYDNQVIPIYKLIDLLHYNCHIGESIAMKTIDLLPVPDDWNNPVILLRQGQQLFALEVDRLVSEQELVIKPFGNTLSAPSYTYGCTILGDGSLIPVLNGSVLLEKFFATSQPIVSSTISSMRIGETSNKRNKTETRNPYQVFTVLVIDDSAAMRRTLALSLEKAGYRVLQARDGKEGIDQLLNSSNINLVICDIEMPNMNGFEFLGQRRRYPEIIQIPVAMLTSRSNDKHRKLATHLGADAYFTKPYIEQKFLTSIKTMIHHQ